MWSYIWLATLAAGVVTAAEQNVTLPSQCNCGYRDPVTQQHYTDAIIVYFNETNIVDRTIFKTLDYEYRIQKGWNTVYRQGANFENLYIGNNESLPWQNRIDGTESSLQMYLDKPTFHHLSDGAELRTLRQDILYGSFRASMRSAHPWVGGSAMSMYLKYNGSEIIEIDMLNKDNASNAQVLQTINGEFPENYMAVNYTIIEKGDPPKIPARSPWDFLEVGFDWTRTSLDFWIENNKTRSIKDGDKDIPSVPQPLYFSHWSTGDKFWTQGPPPNGSVANVQWVRAFFNSSLMTAAQHISYDRNCSMAEACSTADMTLRGSTEFSAAATARWKPPAFLRGIRKIAGYIGAGFAFFGVASLVNAFIRRTPWYKVKAIYFPDKRRRSTIAIRRSLRASIGVDLSSAFPGNSQRHMYKHLEVSAPGIDVPAPEYSSPYPTDYLSPGQMTPLPEYEPGGHSPTESDSRLLPKRSSQSMRSARQHTRTTSAPSPSHKKSGSLASVKTPASVRDRSPSPGPSMFRIVDEDEKSEADDIERARSIRPGDFEEQGLDPMSIAPGDDARQPKPVDEEKKLVQFGFLADKKRSDHPKFGKVPFEVPTEPTVADVLKQSKAVPDALIGAATEDPTHQQKPPAQSKQRIDYLAGLVAIACVGVTFRHFSLTFWPYITSAQPNAVHFKADKVIAEVVGPWFLTPFLIGPFFVTSCRFLVQKYFKTGKLNDIGNRMLIRAPRMLIPCLIFMIIEYFLIELGVTNQLEWLPSVSWSTWPYVTAQSNFGVFMNEFVELSYLIPNGAPEVINHYCVGVLWTIPVQLQFSYVVLLAGVIIHEVKVPWKRWLVYALFILTSWYAVSWSACHWVGVLLADLSINFNMKNWAHEKWYRLYPILLAATLITLGTPLILLFNSAFRPFSFMAWEAAIHPDHATGRPIIDTIPTVWFAYPDFYAPSFAILVFSVGLQLIVELSTWTQALLSVKAVTVLHPHIMTIYLLHGIVFWSLGAYVCVALANINTPYWANLLVTGIVSYALLAIITIILTPLIEYTVRGCIKHLNKWSSEDPLPKRHTMSPFPKELIIGRAEQDPANPTV